VACAPTVEILGVYFPDWLVSAVVGLVFAYSLVWLLGRWPALRGLAGSGLLFCSVTVSAAFVTWWVCFRGF